MSSVLSLEKIHQHLDAISEELQRLKSLPDQSAEIYSTESEALIDVFTDLIGWTAYGDPVTKLLSVPPQLANKFIKNFGTVKVRDATILAAKVISYLRMIEGQVEAEPTQFTIKDTPQSNKPSSARASVDIRASAWGSFPAGDNVRSLITEVSIAIDSVIMISKSSNLSDGQQSLTEIERAELIAILETALSILKSPLTEKGLLEEASSRLKKTALRTAEKQTELALGELSKQAAIGLLKLIALLKP